MTAAAWGVVSGLLFALTFGLLGWLHWLGRRPGSPVPSVGVALGWVMRTPTGRVVTLLFWGWVGFHFFAR